MRAVVSVLSGYGIYQIASSIGVVFLDKLEDCTDFRTSFNILTMIWTVLTIALQRHSLPPGPISAASHPTLEEELLSTSDATYTVVGVLLFARRLIGAVLAYIRGFRIGDLELQLHSLRALAPLFPMAGRSAYTIVSAHFVHHLDDKSSELRKALVISSVPLSGDPLHQLAFDEANEEAIRLAKSRFPHSTCRGSF